MESQNEIEQQDAEIQDDALLFYDDLIEVDGPMNSSELFRDSLNRKRSQLPPLDQKPSVEEILNSIFPPRYIEDPQQQRYFKRCVSANKASREDLKYLEDHLDRKLEERQARKNGICCVREDLHNQLFDEIIRQCTINCQERGLLLLRVRDNLRMTFAAYQTLYQGSVVFGCRKALAAEEGRADLEKSIQDLERKKIFLQNKKIMLENELESLDKSFKEINTIEQARRQSEIKYLQQQQKTLENFIKAYTQQ